MSSRASTASLRDLEQGDSQGTASEGHHRRFKRPRQLRKTVVGRAGIVLLGMTWVLALANLAGSVVHLSLNVHLFEDVVDAAEKHEAAGAAVKDSIAAGRAEAVRDAMRHAWGGYYKYAFGADELMPTSKQPKASILGGVGVKGMGVTIVDALSTLKVMGLEEDFQRGRNWVAANLTFEKHVTVSFFEIVIRVLGGLVSAYDLSGDLMFLKKAKDLADRLLPAFEGVESGIISNVVMLPHVRPHPGGGGVHLAEMGSNVLEFGSVGARTGIKKYRLLAEKGLRRVHSVNHKALIASAVERTSGQAQGAQLTIAAPADSYYEYLLKYYLLRGKRDEHWRQRWVQVMDEVLEKANYMPPGYPFSYAAEIAHGAFVRTTLDHLTCFWPGSVALGVMSGAVGGAKAATYMQFAANMTRACYQLYNGTETGLGAERVEFMPNGCLEGSPCAEPWNVQVMDRHYYQRPEVIESIFYMWRATKDPKYRDWGWRMFVALQKHCKQEGGYSGSFDVMQARVWKPPPSDDTQQSWFLAETLKYFYLLFSPDDVLPLDAWTFNTEAHPLRISALPRPKAWWEETVEPWLRPAPAQFFNVTRRFGVRRWQREKEKDKLQKEPQPPPAWPPPA
eukprot:scaffold20.g7757.t1